MITKPIRLTGHARLQLGFRGTSEPEVVDAIETSAWHPTDLGRVKCRKSFPFNAEWNKKRYATKQARPIFVKEAAEVVVVTGYVYYF